MPILMPPGVQRGQEEPESGGHNRPVRRSLGRAPNTAYGKRKALCGTSFAKVRERLTALRRDLVAVSASLVCAVAVGGCYPDQVPVTPEAVDEFPARGSGPSDPWNAIETEEEAIGRPTWSDPGLLIVDIEDNVARLVSIETIEAWLGETFEMFEASPLWLVGYSTPDTTWNAILDLTPEAGSPSLEVDGAFYIFSANRGDLLRRGSLPHGDKDFASIGALQSEALAIQTPVIDPGDMYVSGTSEPYALEVTGTQPVSTPYP